MESTAPVLKQRNYGIDFLRIVSMFMVVVLHILGHGGVLKAVPVMSLEYKTVWFVEILAYCAVNCYALISGYVGYKSNFRYSNIAYLWLQVTFYTVLIATAFAYFSPDIKLDVVFDAFFPVSNKFYWYFTSYFCMFFFIPLLNKIINSFDTKQLKVIGITIFLLFCILPILAKRDLFFTNEGYSALWLALLYLLGGIIKKCDILSQVKAPILFLVYFLLCAVTWLEKMIVEKHNLNPAINEKWNSVLVEYTSPTILLCGVVLVVAFSKLKINKAFAKVIAFFAPLTFSVYIIHHQKQFLANVITKRFVPFTELPVWQTVLIVLGAALVIFLLCSFIDFIREKLFTLLRIKKILQKLEEKIVGSLWANRKI